MSLFFNTILVASRRPTLSSELQTGLWSSFFFFANRATPLLSLLLLAVALPTTTSAQIGISTERSSGEVASTITGGIAFDVPATAVCFPIQESGASYQDGGYPQDVDGSGFPANGQQPEQSSAPGGQPPMERAHLANASGHSQSGKIYLTSTGNPQPVHQPKGTATTPAPSPTTATTASPAATLSERYGIPTSLPGSRSYLLAIDSTVVFSNPDQFETVLFEIMPLSRSWQVRDYAPRSMSTSNFDGPISEELKEDKSGGMVGDLTGGIPGYADLTLHMDGGKKINSMTRHQRKAPQTQVVTSGLTQRGGGVFFKFNRANDFTIEGGHRLELVLEVPAGWRGDMVQVHCRGIDREGNMEVHNFLMAVTIFGDNDALALARDFAQADRLVQNYLSRWQVNRRPSGFLHDLESALRRDKEPKLPNAEELQSLLLRVRNTDQIPLFQELPKGMQTALRDQVQARNTLLQLSQH